jgi:hypothetical protein
MIPRCGNSRIRICTDLPVSARLVAASGLEAHAIREMRRLYFVLMVMGDNRVGQFELFVGPKAAVRDVTTALEIADR